MINVFVNGSPVPKQSFRYMNNGHHYQTSRVKNWQYEVGHRIKEVWKEYPVSCDVKVYLDFTLQRNQADLDNLAKAVLDGMQGIVYLNDRQVIYLQVTKKKGKLLGVNIKIERADHDL